MNNWLADLDRLIREGKSGVARREIELRVRARRQRPIGRAELAPLAALCRRSGAQELAVRLLHPIVRPKARSPKTATPDELLEYGASLVQLGAEREGRELLDRLDPDLMPQALLFSSFARFQRWEYAEAVPRLERYVSHPSVRDYALRIGQVNLLAALVADARYDRAQPLFEKAAAGLKAEGAQLLYANLLGIWAQKYIYQRDWAPAAECLEEAVALQSQVGDLPVLLARKWRVVLELSRDGVSRAALERLDGIRAEAARLRHWETLRDCDYHQGRFARDERLLAHVYFGTPHEAFRRRMQRECGYVPSERSHVWWPSGEEAKRVVDTLSEKGLKAGQVTQRLLQLVAGDFYRRHRLDALHGDLFPERYYHPTSSVLVMHQSLRRLKLWMSARKIPLTVLEEESLYHLVAQRPCGLRVHLPGEARRASGLEASVALRLEELLGRLARSLEKAPEGQREFSRAEFGRRLALTERSASRYLAYAVKAGLVVSQGRGPAARYRLRSGNR